MNIELFQHNQKAYESALELLESHGKAAIIHPTGTGKSLIAFHLAEEHPDQRVCWLAPSEYIYQTQLENLKKIAGEQLEIITSNILFLTYSKLRMDTEQMEKWNPDYIILDEFHRCGAAEWGKGVQKLLQGCPKAKILGLSATNIRYLDNQRDMAEELFDGCVASEMTLGEAIVKGILPAPSYVLSLYSYKNELEKWSRRVDAITDERKRQENQKLLEKLRRAVENSEGLDEIFARHMKNTKGKYIVFCANREHMEEMMQHTGEWFRKVDKEPHLYAVYCEKSDAGTEFSAFKKDCSHHLKLLFCIDMLNEGVHVEGIDGVILMRPTVSPILYLQQIGRALSAADKNCQPVIFDIVNNFDGLCGIDSLKKEIEHTFAEMHYSIDEKEKFSDKFKIIDEVKDCRILFEQLRKNLTSSWEIYYAAARNYQETHGDLKVPKNYLTEDGLALGSWLTTQRRVRAGKINGILTEEQIQKLDRIGMIWSSASEENFLKGYEALKEYKKIYKTTDVKAAYITEDGFHLGKWISNLRQRRKQYGDAFLSEEKIQMLDELGMIWDKNAMQWEKNYAAARQYYKTHGDLQVPASYCTEDGVRLGNWIANLKQIYAGKKNGTAKLTKEQQEQLEAIGMKWEKRSEDLWQAKYELAKNYYMEHGSLDMPCNYRVNGINLGRWLYNLRLKRKNPNSSGVCLNRARIQKLDAIGMDWKN